MLAPIWHRSEKVSYEAVTGIRKRGDTNWAKIIKDDAANSATGKRKRCYVSEEWEKEARARFGDG